ncbi:MAG: serine/threonine-protein kinase, partial [Actinomycetota bacterium]|nr:serine/threonine-protein kinase [Actinomycetota bacterium]
MAPPVEDSPSVSELSDQLLDSRYRLESLIGRGGMGTVYRALDSRLQRPVAVKILTDAPGADEERFDAEVRTLARLSHPNLVRLLDAGEVDGHLYLVMDLVEGTNLAARLRSGALSEGETVAIGAGVAAALDYVHNEGVIHRDVKPANILLDGRGIAYLTDFGIARLADTSGLTATGTLFGTPAYLAPEQLQGASVGPSADVYGLGLVLIECLTGVRAFTGTLSEVTAGRLLRDPEIPAAFEESWGALLRAMTARDPGQRLAAAAVAAELLAPGHLIRGGVAPGAQAFGSGDTTPMRVAPGFGAAERSNGATERLEATAVGTTAVG